MLPAQDSDIEIKVRRGPSLLLLPDTDMITDGVTTGFAVGGVMAGCKLRVSLSRGDLQVYDTAFAITTHINPSMPDSNIPPATITLHLRALDPKGVQVSALDKTFIIIPSLKPLVTPYIPLPPRWQPRISFRGFRVITWRLREGVVLKNTLTRANERMMRNNVGSSFFYTDNTSGGYQRNYRAIDLKINLNGIQRNMHSNGSSISMLMSEELRKQQGRSDFTLLLHRRYARGSRVDIVDTVQYKAPASSSVFQLKK
ncbi:MAG: hypothetical protein JST90_13805 [Bacteroidetes bacterium]|nr:hypothetical protein [Bacteroidota bacterium]